MAGIPQRAGSGVGSAPMGDARCLWWLSSAFFVRRGAAGRDRAQIWRGYLRPSIIYLWEGRWPFLLSCRHRHIITRAVIGGGSSCINTENKLVERLVGNNQVYPRVNLAHVTEVRVNLFGLM